MSCAELLSPKIMGVSNALSVGGQAADKLVMQVCQDCPNLDPASDNAKWLVDKALICDVICCCRSEVDKQVCVDKTFKSADRALNYKSRYKTEVSYNMTTDPPSPFMHRDDNGRDTTQPSTHWQTRAYQDIQGYRPNTGQVRRPDMVIVSDPSKPPHQANIERVAEVKFGKDPEGNGQFAAYTEIAGDADRFTPVHDSECNCADRHRRPVPVPVPVPVPAPQEEKRPWWDNTAVLTGAVVVGAIATVALAVIPFDGPVGEVAAASATAGAFSRLAASWGATFGGTAAAGGL